MPNPSVGDARAALVTGDRTRLPIHLAGLQGGRRPTSSEVGTTGLPPRWARTPRTCSSPPWLVPSPARTGSGSPARRPAAAPDGHQSGTGPSRSCQSPRRSRRPSPGCRRLRSASTTGAPRCPLASAAAASSAIAHPRPDSLPGSGAAIAQAPTPSQWTRGSAARARAKAPSKCCRRGCPRPSAVPTSSSPRACAALLGSARNMQSCSLHAPDM